MMSKRRKQSRQSDFDRQESRRQHSSGETPISSAYPEIDNDLARDNLENDIPECDLPD